MTNDHDSLFRHTYTRPEHAEALLRPLLPPAVRQALDPGSLRLLPGSSVDEALKNRHSDALFTGTLCGRLVLILTLLEHKSGDDRFTAFQLLRYIVRAYDRWLAENPDARELPPLIPVVVHHGDRPWRAPRSVGELIGLSALPREVRDALAPLQPELRFLLDDLAAVSEQELRERDGTVMHRVTGLLLQFIRPAAKRDPVELVDRWLDLLRELWKHPGGRAGIYAVFSYLASQLEAPPERLAAAGALIDQEAQTMGKTIADQCREEGLKKGLSIADRCREEGLKEGLAIAEQLRQQEARKARAELLLRLASVRFGAVPQSAERRFRDGAVTELDRWAERLLTARDLDDVFA